MALTVGDHDRRFADDDLRRRRSRRRWFVLSSTRAAGDAERAHRDQCAGTQVAEPNLTCFEFTLTTPIRCQASRIDRATRPIEQCATGSSSDPSFRWVTDGDRAETNYFAASCSDGSGSTLRA